MNEDDTSNSVLEWGTDPLFWCFTELTIGQIQSLEVGFSQSGHLLCGKHHIDKVAVMGYVVSSQKRFVGNGVGSLYEMTVDDGTGRIDCVEWLDRETGLSELTLLRHLSLDSQFSEPDLGTLVRVEGRLKFAYDHHEKKPDRSKRQLVVFNVTVVDDPNLEITHWLSVMEATKKIYMQDCDPIFKQVWASLGGCKPLATESEGTVEKVELEKVAVKNTETESPKRVSSTPIDEEILRARTIQDDVENEINGSTINGEDIFSLLCSLTDRDEEAVYPETGLYTFDELQKVVRKHDSSKNLEDSVLRELIAEAKLFKVEGSDGVIKYGVCGSGPFLKAAVIYVLSTFDMEDGIHLYDILGTLQHDDPRFQYVTATMVMDLALEPLMNEGIVYQVSERKRFRMNRDFLLNESQ